MLDIRAVILIALASLAVQPGVAYATQTEEEQAPATTLTVHTEVSRVAPTYDQPGETLIDIETTPYATVRYWNTRAAYGNHAIWQLLPQISPHCEEGSCPLNVLEGEGSSDRPYPFAVEAKGQPVEYNWFQEKLEQEGRQREVPRGADMVVPWSCKGRHIGSTVTYYITEQGGSGPPLEYVGHFKEGLTNRWCSAARLKREHEEYVTQTKARARAKRHYIERLRREREERERVEAEQRSEEQRFESTCRSIGGIPVTVLNSERQWVIVCRSRAGGTIPVP
jgi:hypothetical protein